MKICDTCGIDKRESDYGMTARRNGSRYPTCKACRKLARQPLIRLKNELRGVMERAAKIHSPTCLRKAFENKKSLKDEAAVRIRIRDVERMIAMGTCYFPDAGWGIRGNYSARYWGKEKP